MFSFFFNFKDENGKLSDSAELKTMVEQDERIQKGNVKKKKSFFFKDIKNKKKQKQIFIFIIIDLFEIHFFL